MEEHARRHRSGSIPCEAEQQCGHKTHKYVGGVHQCEKNRSHDNAREIPESSPNGGEENAPEIALFNQRCENDATDQRKSDNGPGMDGRGNPRPIKSQEFQPHAHCEPNQSGAGEIPRGPVDAAQKKTELMRSRYPNSYSSAYEQLCQIPDAHEELSAQLKAHERWVCKSPQWKLQKNNGDHHDKQNRPNDKGIAYCPRALRDTLGRDGLCRNRWGVPEAAVLLHSDCGPTSASSSPQYSFR